MLLPQNIIFTALVPAEISSLYATDIRGCTRDASTGTGQALLQVMPVHTRYNYAIPNALEYYVDFCTVWISASRNSKSTDGPMLI